MAVNVTFVQIGGYAVLPEDVSFGTGGNGLTFQVNNSTSVADVELVKRSVTFSLKGIPQTELATFEGEREAGVTALMQGNGGTSIPIGGYTLSNAILRNVTPQKLITVNGVDLVDVQLEYVSMDYS